MSKATTTPSNRRRRSKLDEELDALLERREKLEAVIASAEAKKVKFTAAIERRFQKEAGVAIEELEELDSKELGPFIERHHYWLTRRHSKTITRPAGVIKEVVRAVEMDKPANTQPIVNFLLTRLGGRRYLKVTYSLDLRVLLNAPKELRAELSERFGFWWGKHRTESVTSPSSRAPKVLSRRRYNHRAYSEPSIKVLPLRDTNERS